MPCLCFRTGLGRRACLPSTSIFPIPGGRSGTRSAASSMSSSCSMSSGRSPAEAGCISGPTSRSTFKPRSRSLPARLRSAAPCPFPKRPPSITSTTAPTSSAARGWPNCRFTGRSLRTYSANLRQADSLPHLAARIVLQVALNGAGQLPAEAAVAVGGTVRRVPGGFQRDGDGVRRVGGDPVLAHLLPQGVVARAADPRPAAQLQGAGHLAAAEGKKAVQALLAAVVQRLLRAEIEERLLVAGAGIVQIDEQRQPLLAGQSQQVFLGGCDFGVVRHVGPVAVVVLWDLLLAAVARGGAVDVHDRHDVDLAPLAEPLGPQLVAGQPLGRAAADPACAGFPGVLPGLHPDRRAVLLVAVALLQSQRGTRTPAARPGQLEGLAAALLSRQR